MVVKLVEFIIFSMSFFCVRCVRVCPTFLEYDFDLKKNCYDNPVVNQNITEIIKSWGFFAEEHYLTTEDGYRILVERAYYKNTSGTPIVLVHGISLNSLTFVNRGNVSLAYLLGKLGYDVWLLNYRGTLYSKSHVNLTTNNPAYWSFTLNDMGIHDIRSTLKHVNEKTKKRPIYIGFSMGTTGFYIYSSTFPDEAKAHVKGMIALAPVINYKGIKSLIRITAMPPIWPILRYLTYLLWNGELLPNPSNYMWPFIKSSLGMYAFQTALNLFFGFDYKQMDALTYPVFPTHSLDSVGVEAYGHYVQIYQSGVFRNYDHGEGKNFEIYGQKHPPAYNLSKVSVPVALYVGKNDILATTASAEQLYSELPDGSRCGYRLVEFRKWNHVDFLIAKDVNRYLYEYMFEKIIQMDKETC